MGQSMVLMFIRSDSRVSVCGSIYPFRLVWTLSMVNDWSWPSGSN